MTLPQEYIDASSNTASRLPSEPAASGQCSFDTSAARTTADGYRYQHALTLADLVVAACDEIDQLRAEIAELTRNEELIREVCDQEIEARGHLSFDLAVKLLKILDGEDET